MTLQQRIKELMRERGVNQLTISRKTGWTKMQVSRKLAANSTLDDDDIMTIATAIGVPVTALVAPVEDREKYEPVIAHYNNSRLSVEEAARLMGKRPMFVRVALQRNQLPFGIALKGEGNRYSYYISKRQFEEYTGIKVPEEATCADQSQQRC